MTDIIEVTDSVTSENFAVAPSAMREFLENHSHVDTTGTVAELMEKAIQVTREINRICQDALMWESGYSYLLGIGYAPGIYRGELPACGWIKEED